MKRLTFYLCSAGVIDGSLQRKEQNKPKRAVMSTEQHVRDLSVRSTLLGTLIERCVRAKRHLQRQRRRRLKRRLPQVLTSCELCRRRETEGARALNSLTREGLAYLGSGDDPALTDFIHEFFCGDDPAYDSPGKPSTSNIGHALPSD